MVSNWMVRLDERIHALGVRRHHHGRVVHKRLNGHVKGVDILHVVHVIVLGKDTIHAFLPSGHEAVLALVTPKLREIERAATILPPVQAVDYFEN